MATASTLGPGAPSTSGRGPGAPPTQDGRTVRIVGAGTKLRLGQQRRARADIELHTTALDRIVAHNAGDLTATLQAGVPLDARPARPSPPPGQMLALDPPLGRVGEADPTPRHRRAGPTIGGVVATGDCGPLRHRYGAPRDLVVGATVALSDGTIAQVGRQGDQERRRL